MQAQSGLLSLTHFYSILCRFFELAQICSLAPQSVSDIDFLSLQKHVFPFITTRIAFQLPCEDFPLMWLWSGVWTPPSSPNQALLPRGCQRPDALSSSYLSAATLHCRSDPSGSPRGADNCLDKESFLLNQIALIASLRSTNSLIIWKSRRRIDFNLFRCILVFSEDDFDDKCTLFPTAPIEGLVCV